MVDEKFLQKAISIRRTYLKLMNNMDLYRAKVGQVSERLDGTLKKIDDYQNELKSNSKNQKTNLSETEIFEKLAKDEMELYRQIVDSHPNLTEDQIVEKVQDRLIKEGLS